MTQNDTAEETKGNQGWGTTKEVARQLGVILAVLVSWISVLGLVLTPPDAGGEATFVQGQDLTWDTHIYPIMQKHCILCHGSSGGLNLTSYENALEGGVNGPAIVPGNAQESLLYLTLRGPVDDIPPMPLGQPPLPEETIQLIEAWINQLPSS